jgi:hypothetical protein
VLAGVLCHQQSGQQAVLSDVDFLRFRERHLPH